MTRLQTLLTKKNLIQLYIKEGLSSTQIAKNIGCNKTTILVYIHKFGIKIKNQQKGK